MEVTPNCIITGLNVANLPSLPVKYVAIAESQIAFRMQTKEIRNPLQRTWQQDIIRIQEPEYVAGGKREALVQTVRRPPVLLKDNAGKPGR